jgi:hypothetical protein
MAGSKHAPLCRRFLARPASESGTLCRALVRTFWFPGWRATLDGAPFRSSRRPLSGPSRSRPPGIVYREPRFGAMPRRRAAAWIAAVAVALTTLLARALPPRPVRMPEAS